MPNDLTAAEQAAAEALAPTIGGEYDPYEIAEMARAVVAAVRGPIARQLLSPQIESIESTIAEFDTCYDDPYEVGILTEMKSTLRQLRFLLDTAERQAEGDGAS